MVSINFSVGCRPAVEEYVAAELKGIIVDREVHHVKLKNKKKIIAEYKKALKES